MLVIVRVHRTHAIVASRPILKEEVGHADIDGGSTEEGGGDVSKADARCDELYLHLFAHTSA